MHNVHEHDWNISEITSKTWNIDISNGLQQRIWDLAMEKLIDPEILIIEDFGKWGTVFIEKIAQLYMKSFCWNGWNNMTFDAINNLMIKEDGSIYRNLNDQVSNLEKILNIKQAFVVLVQRNTTIIWVWWYYIDNLQSLNEEKFQIWDNSLFDTFDKESIYWYLDNLFVDVNFRKQGIAKQIKIVIENHITSLIEEKKIQASFTRNLPDNIQPYKMNREYFWYHDFYKYSDWRVLLYR